MTVRVVLCGLAFLSVLVFPWPLSVLLSLAGAAVFPPIALLAGVLSDALYNPGIFPMASLLGGFATLVAFAVRSFVKARIMGA